MSPASSKTAPDAGQRRSHWDRLPAELQNMVVAAAGPMAQWLVWRRVPAGASKLPLADRQRMWADAIDLDWQGDLAALPLCDVDDAVLARVRSPETLVRLAALRRVHSDWHFKVGKVALTNGWLDAFGHFAKIDQLTAIIETGSLGMLAQYAGRLTESEAWTVKILAGRAAAAGNVAMLEEINAIVPGSWRIPDGLKICGPISNSHLYASTKAVLNEQSDAVEWLLKQKPEDFTDGTLSNAIRDKKVSLLPSIIARVPSSVTSYNALYAVHGGFVDVVSAMIEVAPHIFDEEILQIGIDAGQTEVVAMLVELNPDCINEMHLSWAAESGHVKILEWFLDHGFSHLFLSEVVASGLENEAFMSWIRELLNA
ncbi:hypothetical protein HK105_207921 [Polyrhizophydium stewartii]|uniref:Ankyrin repeat protein n=1 Tax=Polyrhizophydium stewartii TaxID=2732419 RepID=A0ABR4MZA2_9FUNG